MISPIASSLVQPASSTQPAVDGPQLAKLRKGAREFESMMVEQIWKGMKTESDDSGSGQSMSDMASHAFAVGVAARGGFGIAKMILHQLAASANSAAPELKPGVSSADQLSGE
jgi:Rod binding domain-containing protein